MTYTFFLKVKDAINISYVARRGENEPGAVQRSLSKNRIESVSNSF